MNPAPEQPVGTRDFASFMQAYQDMVFSTAARLTGNDAQAEDIAQEVFLKAYENYDHLATSPTAIETDKAFGDYGLDSAFALNLCTDLETELGILVEPTVAWDYPTINDIAGHLAERTGRVR